MPSKLFDAMPRRYRYVVIATVIAISIPLMALALYLTFPELASRSVEIPDLLARSKESALRPTKLIITPIPTGSTPDDLVLNPTPAVAERSLNAVKSPPLLEDAVEQSSNLPATRFNHFPYDEAYGGDIEPIGMFSRESYQREEYLHREAAAAFEQMKAAAAADSIKIQVVSGFRSIAQQSALFEYQVKKEGSEAAAAKLSAPPGHSEHHTGYAVDIGDITLPETDINYDFQNTPAYSWLLTNARRYGFEQSFYENNLQGVSFEPWHWRYIGSDAAIKVFARGRSSP